MANAQNTYIDIAGTNVDKNKITRLVKNVSDIGIDFSIIAERNSQTFDEDDKNIYDVFINNEFNLKDFDVPYFDRKYAKKIEYLEEFCSNNEIEFILHSVSDEAIVYDKFNNFCELSLKDIKLDEQIKTKMNLHFKKIYNLFKFSNGKKAWELFLKFISYGDLMYEIVYKYKPRKEIEEEIEKKSKRVQNIINSTKNLNESLVGKNKEEQEKIKKEQQNWITEKKKIEANISLLNQRIKIYEEYFSFSKDVNFVNAFNKAGDIQYQKEKEEKEDLIPVEIIGIVEVKPETMMPIEYTDKKTKKRYKVWKKIKKNGDYTVLSDNAVIHITYAKVPGSNRRISYAERLIRNFNLTRKLEESRVAWSIMVAQFRMKMVIPITSTLTVKAKQALKQLTDKHKEELIINSKTGETTINGNPHMPYGRHIAIPVRGGNQMDINTISYSGPDLNDMSLVDTFRKNLWRDSWMPQNRFDRSSEKGALVVFKAEGVPYDEIAFYRFINRLRKEFEILIKKPLYIRMLLEYPELKFDNDFENKLGIDYFSESYFEQARELEARKAVLEEVSTEINMTMADGQTPLYSSKYLYVDRHGLMTEEEWKQNEKRKEEEYTEIQKLSKILNGEESSTE
jgi:hypothetical protein